jgi:hypothetical protein
MDHVAHAVARRVGRAVVDLDGLGRVFPVRLPPQDRVELLAGRERRLEVVEGGVVASAGVAVLERHRALRAHPGEAGFDSEVPGDRRGLPQGEVARSEDRAPRRAQRRDPGEHHRDQHDEGDEHHHAALGARRRALAAPGGGYKR